MFFLQVTLLVDAGNSNTSGPVRRLRWAGVGPVGSRAGPPQIAGRQPQGQEQRLQTHSFMAGRPALGRALRSLAKGVREARQETLKLTTALLFPEESCPRVAQVEPFCLSASEYLGNIPVEPRGTNDDFWGPTGPVAIEVVDKDKSLYR